jgi:hypothetical protein
MTVRNITSHPHWWEKIWDDYENAAIELRKVTDTIQAMEKEGKESQHLENKWIYWKKRVNHYQWMIDDNHKKEKGDSPALG